MDSSDISYKYYCRECNYNTSRKSQYERHIMTSKHLIRTNTNDLVPKSSKCYTCKCNKVFKHASSLWNHKQKCTFVELDETHINVMDNSRQSVDSKLILELLQQNKELHKMVIDLAKNTNHTTNNNTINNTNNTTNNNRFNLNVYLNETCKDAINLNDFIQSIELNVNDFINTGEVGYVKGISNIMVERIRDMEPHIRPIHCTDLKRETVYVKDSDKWAKEDENKTHIRKAIRIVADKNKNLVHSWIEENPNYEILDTPECNKFFEYTKASLGGYGKEEDLKFENKIINNILKETIIDKNVIDN